MKILNPLKSQTEYGWHFEQNVYASAGLTRAVKAGGGSGNIPKIIDDMAKKYRIRKLTPTECFALMGVRERERETYALRSQRIAAVQDGGE